MYRHASQSRHSKSRTFVRERPVWPLPILDGHLPVIITVTQVTREALLAYGHAVHTDASAQASSPYFMPSRTPVLAMRSGTVLSVSERDGATRIVLDHGNGFTTAYEGLDEAISRPARRRRRVSAGDVIGTIRCPGPDLRPLQFTLSRTDLIPGLPGFPCAVDPLDVLLSTIKVSVAISPSPASLKETA